MNLPDFLVDAADGEMMLRGHRIGLFHIVTHYNDGYSPEMLVSQYPSLPLALVHKVIAFYLENRGEVDAYVALYQAELDQQRAEGRQIDINALRQRLDAMRQSEARAPVKSP